MAALLQLNDRDNVRIALQKMPAGSEVEGLRIWMKSLLGIRLPFGRLKKMQLLSNMAK